jgi:hypothetical protein
MGNRTTRTPKTPCLKCGRPLDAATNPSNDFTPVEGDISMCLHCGHVMAFDADLRFRELNEQERREVEGDARVIALQKARREYKR